MDNSYNVFLKIFVIIIISAMLVFALSGSYAPNNIDKIGYSVALAIDKGSDNNIKLTVQLSKPSSSSSSSSTSQSTSSSVESIECSSIESGINLFNNFLSKNINLSQCKVIIISEKLAVTDISTYIYDLMNNVEVSPHANIIISKCEASSYLKLCNPILENFSARYYNVTPNSSKTTGYIKSITLIDFFNSYLDNFRQPIATLGNINTDSTHIKDINNNFTNSNSSYKAR